LYKSLPVSSSVIALANACCVVSPSARSSSAHVTTACQHNRARNRIRNVVMRARAVVNAVFATTRRPALKAVKLGDQAADIKQLAFARIE
jgi:hypothetical protein